MFALPPFWNARVTRRSGTSLLLTGSVLARVGRAYQCVWTRLDGGGKFSEVLRDLAHVIEEFIHVFRVDVESLSEAGGDIRHGGQSAAKFDHGLAEVRAIFSDYGIEVIQGPIRFLGCFVEILEQWLEFFAERVDALQGGADLRAVLFDHAAHVCQGSREISAILHAQQVIDAIDSHL